VKRNSKELLKWIDYNSSQSKPIDETVTYDHNTHGRYEERVCQIVTTHPPKSPTKTPHKNVQNSSTNHPVLTPFSGLFSYNNTI